MVYSVENQWGEIRQASSSHGATVLPRRGFSSILQIAGSRSHYSLPTVQVSKYKQDLRGWLHWCEHEASVKTKVGNPSNHINMRCA